MKDTIPSAIAFVTESPWPARNGVTSKSGPLLKALPYRVELIGPFLNTEAPSHIRFHQLECGCKKKTLQRVAQIMYRRQLVSFGNIDVDEAMMTTRRILESTTPRFIHLDTMGTAHLVAPLRQLLKERDLDEVPIILSINDSYSLLKSTSSTGSRLKQWAIRSYLASVEKKHLPLADAIDVVSPADLAYLRDLVPNAHTRVIGLGRPTTTYERSIEDRTRDILIFSAAPGLADFLTRTLPMVRSQLPNLTIDMVGAPPTGDLMKSASRSGVRILGYVDDLDERVQDSRLVVAPSQQTAGTSTKALRAMSLGTPVVGGRCLSGISGFTDETHGGLAQNPEVMAQKIVKALTDRDTWDRFNTQARALVEGIPDWSEQGAQYASSLPTRTASDNG